MIGAGGLIPRADYSAARFGAQEKIAQDMVWRSCCPTALCCFPGWNGLDLVPSAMGPDVEANRIRWREIRPGMACRAMC